jgi:hypothetical protein
MHWFDPPKARIVQRSVAARDDVDPPQSKAGESIRVGEGSD